MSAAARLRRAGAVPRGPSPRDATRSPVRPSSSAGAPSRRRALLAGPLCTYLLSAPPPAPADPPPPPAPPRPRDLGEGVRGVDLDPAPANARVARPGDRVRVLLRGRLFAKQGWIFANDYADGPGGTPEPRTFVLGAGEVIRGLDVAVEGMAEGQVRRVVIPPSASYQSEADEPVPRDFANRRRLYTTIFNPTRIANGEGDTLATVIFDVELVRVAGASERD